MNSLASTIVTGLISAFAAAGLTTWFSLWRFRKERWWDKKYEAYISLLNSINVIHRGFFDTIQVFDDRIVDTGGAEKAVERLGAARTELRRLIDIGDLVISAATVQELIRSMTEVSIV